MASQFDSSDVQAVRILVADTDPKNYIWSPQEVEVALSIGGNVNLAASWLLEAAATDAAKCAVIQKNDQYSTDLTKIPALLAERAKRLRDLAITPIAIKSAPAMFTLGDPDEGTVGTMDLW